MREFGLGGVVVLPPPDAIQEFRTEENSMSAEFGRGGAAVNVVLKLLLMGPLAQVGLALATAVGAWINLLLVLWFAVRANHLEFDRDFVQSLAKFFGSGVVLALAFWLTRKFAATRESPSAQ